MIVRAEVQFSNETVKESWVQEEIFAIVQARIQAESIEKRLNLEKLML